MADVSKVPPKLAAYWLAGPGAAKIKWGVPGDFDRCVLEVQKAVTDGGHAPLSDRMIKGMCANMHKESTGASPGHASGEMHAKR